MSDSKQSGRNLAEIMSPQVLAWRESITPERFAGKTVIVTGAASGIGRATASRVAREGGRVIAVDLVTEGIESLASELGAAAITTVRADLSKPGDIDAIVEAAGDSIDGLANVAGIMDRFQPLHEVGDELWDQVFAVNLTGLMRLSRAVLPSMLAAQRGSIVNISSEAGLRGGAAGAAYTASKHAVVGLTKSCAFMYWPKGVRVNAVAPGPTLTGMQANFESDMGRERLASAMGAIPKLATAEALAASISFLLSDDAVNISGAILPSDGGWNAL